MGLLCNSKPLSPSNPQTLSFFQEQLTRLLVDVVLVILETVMSMIMKCNIRFHIYNKTNLWITSQLRLYDEEYFLDIMTTMLSFACWMLYFPLRDLWVLTIGSLLPDGFLINYSKIIPLLIHRFQQRVVLVLFWRIG